MDIDKYGNYISNYYYFIVTGERMMISERVRNKLHSKIGESIAETLVALLIGALALTMLAGAVGAAFRMINTNKKAVNEYYTNTNNLVTLDSGLKSAGITVTGGENSGISSESYNVQYVENSSFSKTPVIAYKVVS